MTEILISAAYVFLVVNLLASAGTEAIASLFSWRARMLADGVAAMLNEGRTGLASAVYQSPLVHPRSTGEDEAAAGRSLPSYIPPVNFANALLAVLRLDQATLDPLKRMDVPQIDAWIMANIESLRQDARLRMLLAHSIHRNGADLAALRNAIANWFTNTTDRISGSFKRRTQLSGFLIALVMAVVFNLSPLPPALIATLQQNATASPEGNAAWTAVVRVLGQFSIALSTLLGAPFWFGILSKVSNPKGTGGSSAAPEPPVAQVTATAAPGGTATATTGAPGEAPPETGAPPQNGAPPPAS